MSRRSFASLAAAASVAALALPAATRGDLASRYSAGQQRAGQLQAEITAETNRIAGYEGSLQSLRAQLAGLERSLGIQEQLLGRVRGDLTSARAQLRMLEARYAQGRQVLADQLRAEYESPPPTIIDVVVDAHGFEDLLNRINEVKSIERLNAATIIAVRSSKYATAVQAARLAREEKRRQRATAAVLVERDQVAQLRFSIVRRELAEENARAHNRGQLRSLQQKLASEAAALDRAAAAAQGAASGGAAPAPGACVNTPFVPHGGPYGFFPAPGTNYSVGQEPIIAARLDALGKGLQLHLIGISGYRSPQHSVEVGGFADDPHTQGRASDTPGVEGVPESTLEAYCLTRPFGGAREADHIQEL